MPNKTFTVNDFSGGTNTFESPQNVEPNELVVCKGFHIIPGEVSVIGDMKAAYNLGGHTAANAATTIESGYGLFAFSHDYDAAGDLNSTNYTILMDGVTFDKYHDSADDNSDDAWVHEAINLGTVASGASFAGSVKPCFFIVDGALRVSPGNFSSKDTDGDMAGSSGNFTAKDVYGFHESKTAISDLTDDITVGDTIILNNQEMIALRVQATTLDVARNMTGLFSAATNNSDVVYVVMDNRWRGIVYRKNFGNVTTIGTFTNWYSSFSTPRPPVAYQADIDHDNVSPDYTYPFLVKYAVGDITSNGEQSPCLHIGYYQHGTNSANVNATWAGAVINLYTTALYDESRQESQPNKFETDITVATATELGIYVNVEYSDDGST